MTFTAFPPRFRAAFTALLSVITGIAASSVTSGMTFAGPPHPTWLEERQGAEATAWADAQTARVRATLLDETANPLRVAAQQVLGHPEYSAYTAFPEVHLAGDNVIRFDWETFSWASTTFRDYASDRPQWRPAASMAAVARPGEQLMPRPWRSISCHSAGRRCLVTVTAGGFDRVMLREVDLTTGRSPADAFSVPESPFPAAAWVDENTLLVSADFGPGSLNTAGDNPRRVKLWRRGTTLAAAPVVFEGPATGGYLVPMQSGGETLVVSQISFPNRLAVHHLRAGAFRRIDLPERSEPIGVVDGRLLAVLYEDWPVAGRRVGQVVSIDLSSPGRGRRQRVELAFTPPAGEYMVGTAIEQSWAIGRRSALLRTNSAGGQAAWQVAREHGRWRSKRLALPPHSAIAFHADRDDRDEALISTESLTRPPELVRIDAAGHVAAVRSRSALFDASGLETSRLSVRGSDGVEIPYLLVRRAGATGPAPLILYGYGAAQHVISPKYDPVLGRLWLERGGAYAVAFVRGGGEQGSAWYEAARGVRKTRSFDDMAAVARELIRTGVTTPAQLGLNGLSAGGLLVASTAALHPDLFTAVVARDPLVDPLLEGRLANGAALGDYGNLDNAAVRRAIEGYAANRVFGPGRRAPSFLILAHRSDQRVHVANARALAWSLQTIGQDATLHEARTGDHGTLSLDDIVLMYVFLSKGLGLTAT